MSEILWRCGKCKTIYRNSELQTLGFNCNICNSKVFYKVRPNIRKVIKAR